MFEINVQFSDIITPNVCSVIIKQLIKYIAYNSQQIPYTYEALTHLVNKFDIENRNAEEEIKPSWKRNQARKFYKQIARLFSNFENTFKNIGLSIKNRIWLPHTKGRFTPSLEKYFMEVHKMRLHKGDIYHVRSTQYKKTTALNIEAELVNSTGIEEVIILLGSNIVCPKYIYRICIPQMELGHCSVNHPLSRSLDALYRKIINSYDLNKIFERNTEPTNTYIILKMVDGYCPKSSWFLPNDNFRIPSKAHQMIFRFDTPAYGQCSCLENQIRIYQDSPKFALSSQTPRSIVSSRLNAELRDVLEDITLKNTTDKDGVFNPLCESETSRKKYEVSDLKLVRPQSVPDDGENEGIKYCTNWYQTRESLQGFKDFKVNGHSIFNYLLSFSTPQNVHKSSSLD